MGGLAGMHNAHYVTLWQCCALCCAQHARPRLQALRRLSPHANIIALREVLYDQPTGRLALVFELMDMNIYELIRWVK